MWYVWVVGLVLASAGCDLVFAPDGVDTPDAVPPGDYCPTEDGAAGYWRLDEAGGMLARDSSDNGIDGTYTGSVTFGVGGALGDTNTAVAFSGTTRGQVVLGDRFAFAGIDAFSVEAWVKPSTVVAGSRHIVTRQTRLAPKEGWALLIDPAGLAYLERYFDDADGAASPAAGIAAGGFTHIVGTYDGLIQRLYVNGVEAGNSDTRSLPVANAPAIIGSASVSVLDSNFDGVLDEVAIHQVALAPQVVMKHFLDAQSGSCLDE